MKTNPNDPATISDLATIAFHQGYATACANIMRLRGTEVNAREVLTQAFHTMKSLRTYMIDSSDLEILIPLMNEHIRLEKIADKRRSALNESSTEN